MEEHKREPRRQSIYSTSLFSLSLSLSLSLMPCQPLVIGTRYPFHRLSMAHRPSVLIPPLYGAIPCTCIIYFTVCHYYIARCRGPTLGGETLYTSFALALSPSYVYFFLWTHFGLSVDCHSTTRAYSAAGREPANAE
jgi:hypothetical protein